MKSLLPERVKGFCFLWRMPFLCCDLSLDLTYKADKENMKIANNKGFTLAELTVASGVAGVVTLALSTLMIWAVMEFEGVKRRLVAQSEALKGEVMLRRYVTNAVKVLGGAGNDLANGTTTVGNGVGASNIFDGHGRFAADFNYDQMADWPVSGWKNVGAFLREWREPIISGGPPNRRSQLFPTGIFIRAPTATTSGVMFIDTGEIPPAGMTPGYGDQWMGGLTEFELSRQEKVADGTMAGQNRIVSLLFRYRVRYHMSTNLPKRWCPTADVVAAVAGCTGGAGYADIERSVRIVLVNNNIGTRQPQAAPNDWVQERPLGSLHFFRPIFPNVWRN